MFRVAIQVKDIIASNVTSALDGVTNPAKMLRQLQREVEEAIIALQGELTRARRRHERLETERTQAELREADWGDKAQIAMDNRREDLARQALLAREDCRKGLDALSTEIATLANDIADMELALDQLEAKRTDTRQRLADQLAADGESAAAPGESGFARRTDRRMDHITKMEQRTNFATEDSGVCRGNAAVDREIEEVRRAKTVDAELAVLREASAVSGAATRKPARKKAR